MSRIAWIERNPQFVVMICITHLIELTALSLLVQTAA